MNGVGVRLIIVLILSLSIWGIVWITRHFIERNRHQASSADPMPRLEALGEETDTLPARVRILAFSSEDCRQCHTLQAPVLRRVKEAYGNILTIIEIDATTSPELTTRYHVLTLPTTVLLDVKGRPHAVNYGFTNAQSLL